MKSYQTFDILHGHGKAFPKPNQPTNRGGRVPWRFVRYAAGNGSPYDANKVCYVTNCRKLEQRAIAKTEGRTA